MIYTVLKLKTLKDTIILNKISNITTYIMESSASFKKSFVVIGLAGKGKSSILNTLIAGDPNSEVFKAAKSKKAVTTQVSSVDV